MSGQTHRVGWLLPLAWLLSGAGVPGPAESGEPPKLLYTLREHASTVTAVAFSPDEGMLATASWRKDGSRGEVLLRDVTTGQVKRTIPLENAWVGALAFSRNGLTLAVGTGRSPGPGLVVAEVRLFDPYTGNLVRTLTGHEGWWTVSVAVSPDGETVAGATHRLDKRMTFVGEVNVWEAATGQLKRTLNLPGGKFFAVAFSPDGKTLAGGGFKHRGEEQLGEVYLWDAETGFLKRRLTGYVLGVNALTFSPDGRTLATDDDRPEGTAVVGQISLWDPQAGTLKKSLSGHRGALGALAFSRDGRLLVSGGDDGTVKLWDGFSGGWKWTLTGHTEPVASVAVSPDGRLVASGSVDKTVRVWDVSPLMAPTTTRATTTTQSAAPH